MPQRTAWIGFTSFTNAMRREDSVPKLTFGKRYAEGGAWTMPVCVEVHHALVDGIDGSCDDPALWAARRVGKGITFGSLLLAASIVVPVPLVARHTAGVRDRLAQRGPRLALRRRHRHPQPRAPDAARPLDRPALPPLPADARGAPTDVEALAALRAADQAFARVAAERGFATALAEATADDVRLHRPGIAPVVGREDVAVLTDTISRRYSAEPGEAHVSRHGDLGYTVGEYRLTDESGNGRHESGWYLRIWTRKGGAWRILLDAVSPLPPEREE